MHLKLWRSRHRCRNLVSNGSGLGDGAGDGSGYHGGGWNVGQGGRPGGRLGGWREVVRHQRRRHRRCGDGQRMADGGGLGQRGGGERGHQRSSGGSSGDNGRAGSGSAGGGLWRWGRVFRPVLLVLGRRRRLVVQVGKSPSEQFPSGAHGAFGGQGYNMSEQLGVQGGAGLSSNLYARWRARSRFGSPRGFSGFKGRVAGAPRGLGVGCNGGETAEIVKASVPAKAARRGRVGGTLPGDAGRDGVGGAGEGSRRRRRRRRGARGGIGVGDGCSRHGGRSHSHSPTFVERRYDRRDEVMR